MTVDQIKQYFTNHIKVIDPIEGIWLRHLKTRTYLKGEEIPKFNTIDTQIVIFREEEAFKCYYLNSTLGHEVYDLVILNSAVDNLYFCTYNSDFFKFFGECTFVNQSFKIVGNQFEVNYEMECLKKDHGYVYNGITEYFGTYEKLFPKQRFDSKREKFIINLSIEFGNYYTILIVN